ncbi:MAG: FAD-dependent oxidoreductase [Candidatus Dadabacteria bacterium]|nr:MAG: FAD-dependent oxidoreductase [Candidatus Dadabacteria bacterium]
MPDYDLIIVGGGVSGVSLAELAAAGGYKTLLLEKGRFFGATSSNSMRIIHGGLRYLQQMDFARIRESVKAQSELLAIGQGLIEPLSCIMPLSKNSLKRSRLFVGLGALLYRILSCGVRSELKKPSLVDAGFVKVELPGLEQLAGAGALFWQDAQIVDLSKFHELLIDRAKEAGADLLEQSPVKQVTADADLLRVHFERDGYDTALCSSYVINTSGPWLKTFEVPDTGLRVNGWCKSFNLVFNLNAPFEYAVGLEGPENRLFFIVPRKGELAVGTWNLPFNSNADQLKITEPEIDVAINDINTIVPSVNFKREQIVRVEAGILPAKGVNAAGGIKLYGQEQIWRNGNYIEVLSTKYTTAREQARRVLKLLN